MYREMCVKYLQSTFSKVILKNKDIIRRATFCLFLGLPLNQNALLLFLNGHLVAISTVGKLLFNCNINQMSNPPSERSS